MRGTGYQYDCSEEALVTRLTVVHPVEDDLGGPVPAGHHVAGHLTLLVSGQAKVQDLETHGLL